MLTNDMANVIKRSNLLQKEVDKILIKNDIVQPFEEKFNILPGAEEIDRHVQYYIKDGKEVLTLELSGRSVSVMELGFRLI